MFVALHIRVICISAVLQLNFNKVNNILALGRHLGFYEFKASLGYRESSKTAEVTQRDLDLGWGGEGAPNRKSGRTA